MWDRLRDAYNKLAEKYMNIENGGRGGRPVP